MKSSEPIRASSKSLFDFYDVRIVETRRYYDPKVIDGVLVIDL